MANQVGNAAKGMMLKGQITALTDTFNVILMQSGFVFNNATQHRYADVLASEVPNGLGYVTGVRSWQEWLSLSMTP